MNYLFHSGQLGQKWGERNGPPYPLDKETVLENDSQVGSIYTNRDRFKKESVKRNGKYVSATKQLLDQNNTNSRRVLTKSDLKTINPNFGEPGTTMNCMKCVAAVELKKRGYSASAGRASAPIYSKALGYWFTGAKTYTVDYKDAETTIRNHGKGSSGYITMMYDDDVGHVMAWTVKKDGRIQIEDGQSGDVYTGLDSVCRDYGFSKSKAYIGRLDNCEINKAHMIEDSVAVPSGATTYRQSKITQRIKGDW